MLSISSRFLVSVIIAMGLMAVQTSMSNLFWLLSVDMPISLVVFISTLLSDLIGMSFNGEVPIIGVVLVGLLIAFVVAHFVIKYTGLARVPGYMFAGAAALFAIVVLMPLAFYNLDLIAGARTFIGKCCLITGGALSGYFFAVTGDEGRAHD